DPQLEPGRSGRRWCSGTVKVASDLVRLEDGLDHLHAAATSLAALDVDREDAREQTSPCDAAGAGSGGKGSPATKGLPSGLSSDSCTCAGSGTLGLGAMRGRR